MFGRFAWPAGAALLAFVALSISNRPAGFDRAHAQRADAATPAAPRSVTSIAVRTLGGSSAQRVAAYARGRGYAVRAAAGVDALEITPPAGVTIVRALSDLAVYPGVLYAEPAYTVRVTETPADPLFARQALYLNAVHATQAWDIEQGKPDVLVAVLDTGIDRDHPDLQGRIWTNPSEVAGNGADDDQNGCVDDVHGCGFVTDDAGCVWALADDVDDGVGHGTFVAGVIAANSNSVGIVGVARGVTILPVKVLDCTGSGDTLALAQGILYAAKQGAKVINVSLGGPDSSVLVRQAVGVATEQYGALVVAATGNTGALGVVYPARFPEVLAVGAASAADPDRRASFSTYGPEVDVVAVGEGVIGTVPASRCNVFLKCVSGLPYAAANGTSFAAPQASGLAALIVSHRRGTSPQALLQLIKSSADPIAGGAAWSGAGLINMFNALKPAYRLGAPGTVRN